MTDTKDPSRILSLLKPNEVERVRTTMGDTAFGFTPNNCTGHYKLDLAKEHQVKGLHEHAVNPLMCCSVMLQFH